VLRTNINFDFQNFLLEYQKLAELNCNEKKYKTVISMYKVHQLKNHKVREGVYELPPRPLNTPLASNQFL